MSNEKPKLLTERIDLKAFTANVFGTSIEKIKNGELENISLDPNTELVFFTPFGSVVGEIYIPPKDTDKFDAVSFFHEAFINARDSLLSSYIEDGVKRLTNDSSFVLLKNAKIRLFTGPNVAYNLEYFLLYSDAILGMSYGNQRVE
jgi:hypothetical protein